MNSRRPLRNVHVVPVLMNSFQARYLLVNATLLILTIFCLLGDILGFYSVGRMGRMVLLAGVCLFSVNVLGSMVQIIYKALRVLLAPSKPASPKKEKEPTAVSSEKILPLVASEFKEQQSMPSPIRLMSTPSKKPAEQHSSPMTGTASPIMGPSTPFTLRMTAAASSPLGPVAQLQIPPVNQAFKVSELPQPKKEMEEVISKGALKEKSKGRKIYQGEAALRYLGISYERLDALTDNLRVWFSRQVLTPLVRSIEECEEHFGKAGWSHLGPSHPAVYSLLPANGSKMNWERGFVIPQHGAPSMPTRVQTLLELAQTYRGDPMVTLRLRIEKYLDTGNSIAGHRSVTLQRIKQMAADPWVRASSGDQQQHNSLLMHLFCSYLDENMLAPGSDAQMDHIVPQQPLSSRSFVALGEPEGSFASGTPKLQHVSSQQFRVLLPDGAALEMPPGMNHLLHVLVLFLEYIRMRLRGHLGLSNLATPRLQLMQVLEENGPFSR